MLKAGIIPFISLYMAPNIVFYMIEMINEWINEKATSQEYSVFIIHIYTLISTSYKKFSYFKILLSILAHSWPRAVLIYRL